MDQIGMWIFGLNQVHFLNSLLTDELGEESLEGTATEEMMKEIKETFPDSTDKQILDELKKYIAVEDPFESLNLKKPKKFDKLKETYRKEFLDKMKARNITDQDELQDLADEVMAEQRFWGAR